jgi:hypothetical protein
MTEGAKVVRVTSHPIDDDGPHSRRRIRHLHRPVQERPRHFEPSPTAMANDHDAISGAHLGARRRDDGNPHAMVYDIVQPPAPGAERDGGTADVLGLEPGHEPIARRSHDLDVRR